MQLLVLTVSVSSFRDALHTKVSDGRIPRNSGGRYGKSRKYSATGEGGLMISVELLIN